MQQSTTRKNFKIGDSVDVDYHVKISVPFSFICLYLAFLTLVYVV